MEDGFWKEAFEAYDVFVRDVIVEGVVVGVNRSVPKFIKMFFCNEGSEFRVVHVRRARRRDVWISLEGGKILF